MAKTDRAPADGVVPGGVTLDRSPSHLLHRALQHALDIYGAETGDGALTQRQFAVLSAVEANEGLTQTDLVRATGIDRSTLADMVARMIAKGLLGRERSTADARANVVRLTDSGRAALAETTPRVAAADARILELLPAKSRDSFLKTLGALSAAAEAGLPGADMVLTPEGPEPAGDKKKRKKGDKAAKADKPEKADKADKKKRKKDKKAARAAGGEPPPSL
jgi:DNA-binding MarR family transcriptional regulator